jgi:hypothetical protein
MEEFGTMTAKLDANDDYSKSGKQSGKSSQQSQQGQQKR